MQPQLPEGVTAKFAHYRRIRLRESFSPEDYFVDRIDEHIFPDQILPRGGFTECYLYDSEGNKIGEAMAACNDRDNFNKKIGRAIALGRALHSLEKDKQ